MTWIVKSKPYFKRIETENPVVDIVRMVRDWENTETGEIKTM